MRPVRLDIFVRALMGGGTETWGGRVCIVLVGMWLIFPPCETIRLFQVVSHTADPVLLLSRPAAVALCLCVANAATPHAQSRHPPDSHLQLYEVSTAHDDVDGSGGVNLRVPFGSAGVCQIYT